MCLKRDNLRVGFQHNEARKQKIVEAEISGMSQWPYMCVCPTPSVS